MSSNFSNIVLRFSRTLLICALPLIAVGCNLEAEFVKSTVDGTKKSTAGQRSWDPDIVEHAILNGITMNEGYMEIAPDYEPLLLNAIFNYVAYGNQWLGEKAAAAEAAGNFDEIDRINKKQGLLYSRGVTIGKHLLRLRDKGFDDAVHGGVDKFKDWVDVNFYEKRDAEAALWTGVVWAATMEASEEGFAATADRPYAEALIRRSVEIDPELQGAMGLAILGTIECTVPQGVGGNPRKGKALLERAAAITKRENHTILIALAERCAVALQDRKGFMSLLMEIIESPDRDQYRLQNKFARRKAERLIKKVDDLFFQ